MKRRPFLGLVGGAGVTVAGCIGFGGTNETIGVTVENRDAAAHELTVVVRLDDTALLDRTVTVGPGETADVSFENPTAAGEAAVTVRSARGAETSVGVRAGPGTGLRRITVLVRDGGTLTVRAART